MKWRFPEIGVPLNHPFIEFYRWIFHEINHPAIKGYPHLWKAPKVWWCRAVVNNGDGAKLKTLYSQTDWSFALASHPVFRVSAKF